MGGALNKVYNFDLELPETDFVTEAEDLSGILREWDALCARDKEAGLFLSPRWLAPVLRARPGQWMLLTVRDATGRLVGLLPLWRRRDRERDTEATRTEIDAAGRMVWSEYCGFICDPVAEGEALDAMGAAVRKLDWDEFALPYVLQTERLERFAANFDPQSFMVGWPPLMLNGGAVDSHKSPQLALPGSFDTFLDTALNKNTREKLVRMQHKFLDSGDLHVKDAAKGDEFEPVLDHALTLWQGRWRSGETQVTRYRALFRMARIQGLLTVPTLYEGPRMVGALFNIADARMGYELFKLAARDPERNDLPIGLLLHGHAIRTAIARGRLIYDFGHGDDAYKYGFGAEDAETKSLIIARITGR